MCVHVSVLRVITYTFMHDASLTIRGNQIMYMQEYEAVQDEDPATPKLCWEIEQVGYNASLLAEIAR